MSDTDLVTGVDLPACAARPRQERARRGLRRTACRLVTERCACGRHRWRAGDGTAWEGGGRGDAETSVNYYRLSRGRTLGPRRHRPRYLLCSWRGLEQRVDLTMHRLHGGSDWHCSWLKKLAVPRGASLATV